MDRDSGRPLSGAENPVKFSKEVQPGDSVCVCMCVRERKRQGVKEVVCVRERDSDSFATAESSPRVPLPQNFSPYQSFDYT